MFVIRDITENCTQCALLIGRVPVKKRVNARAKNILKCDFFNFVVPASAQLSETGRNKLTTNLMHREPYSHAKQ